MATAGGANIAVDGLVFGYDTGYPLVSGNLDTYKFNLGKPTVNLLEQSGATSLDVRTDIYGNVTKTNLGGGKYRFVNDGTGGTTIRLYCNVNDLTNGNVYGCSISYENFDPGVGTSVTLDWCDVNSTSFSVGTYGTSGRIFMSASRATYDNTYRFFDITIPVSSSIDLFNAQVEAQTPSPFTTNTRSVSGSLIDLTRTTDIDLSNVSFDSNAQMTFDGTDDYIDLGDDSRFDFDNGIMTVEAIVTFPSSWTAGSQYPNIVSKGASAGWDTDGWSLFGFRDWGGGKSWGLGIRNGATNRIVSRQNVAEDVYWHIVGTLDGTTMRLYENGVEVSTNTQTINPANNNTSVRIARDPNSNYFPGEIPVVKIYNRALTAAEIQQNYNALKERFSL